MRYQFEEQLEQLNDALIRMGALCEDAIAAVAALLPKAGVVELTAEISAISAIEVEIDQKERDIETLCMKLLLQQQPVARDLRLISAALKMISDMERIGDQALDIAEIAKFLNGEETQSHAHIGEMAQATIHMVTQSIDSFVNRDLQLARQVIAADDTVDGLFQRVKQDLLCLIAQNAVSGEYCLDLLMIAKYFERIGDHAVNIAEWVEFSILGVRRSDSSADEK